MIGLDDVIAAETALSHVDGEAGRLILRGQDLEARAGQAHFESVTSDLWSGIVPGTGDDIVRDIGLGRVAAFERFLPLVEQLDGLGPVAGMRMLLAAIDDDAPLGEAAALVGATGVAAAMATRAEMGGAPVAPDAGLGHAADILRMIRGENPSAAQAQALDTYLVTIVDHGLNASTFAARVVASTQAGLVSSVLAGLSALKGPLHGGAPGPVLDMIDAIGRAENAVSWLEAALDRGERLMGFGHRIYRTRDPRADVLKAALKKLGADTKRLHLAEAVENEALDLLAARKAGRKLDVNVEFYTALLLDALGLPRDAFTAIFGAGRVSGWIGHAAEQQATGRLIRPQSRYVGDFPQEAA